MLRFSAVSSLILAFVLLIGCAHRGRTARHPDDSLFNGPVELTFENRTKLQIEMLLIHDATSSEPDSRNTRALIARSTDGIMLASGATAKFKLAAGTYRVSAEGAPTNSGYSPLSSLVRLLVDYKLDLTAPTQLVLYDATPPTDVVKPLGAQQVMVLSWTESAKQQAASDYAACQKAVPHPNESPVPSKTKVSGSWTCVMGGGVKGTNFVRLVQLANGTITATLSGADGSTSWEGVVRGDELRYRFAGLDTAGGVLKIDPGGRAMTGSGNTWLPNEARCLSYSMTCTR